MRVAATTVDLYVYYQVDAARAPALAQRVRAMQAALGHGMLKRRPAEREGSQTWMEIYPACTEAQRAAIEAAVVAAKLDGLTSGPRHTEIFVDLDLPIDREAAAPCA